MLLLASGYCIILCIVSMHKFHKKKERNYNWTRSYKNTTIHLSSYS